MWVSETEKNESSVLCRRWFPNYLVPVKVYHFNGLKIHTPGSKIERQIGFKTIIKENLHKTDEMKKSKSILTRQTCLINRLELTIIMLMFRRIFSFNRIFRIFGPKRI